MIIQELNGNKLEKTGKGVARKLRGQGFVPAVCYGHGIEGAIPLYIDPVSLKNGLKTEFGRNAIFDLKLDDGTKHSVMMQAYQKEVLGNKLTHVDLLAVDMNAPIHAKVPIDFTGRSKGVALSGGMLEFKRFALEVECLPANLPLKITVPVDDLDINQSIHVRDVTLPEGVKAVTPERITLVVCQVVGDDTPAAKASDAAAAPAAK